MLSCHAMCHDMQCDVMPCSDMSWHGHDHGHGHGKAMPYDAMQCNAVPCITIAREPTKLVKVPVLVWYKPSCCRLIDIIMLC